MPYATLSHCIVKSLKEREMVRDFSHALLSTVQTDQQTEQMNVIHRDETEYWDYKEQLYLENPNEAASTAKDILGFHNAKGGVLIIGIDDDFNPIGISKSTVLDTNKLHGKLRKYIGPDVLLFQNTIDLPNGKVVWLIFIPKRDGAPVPVASNGPQDEKGKPLIRKNEYYIRIADEVKPCIEPSDFQRLFANFSMDHIHAYIYDIDEPYFRLLAPHCNQFVGRDQILHKVTKALKTRHPIIALDGVGGVGKSAVAIELVRQFYNDSKYLFIVSQSAKSKVWHDYIGSRRAGFSGFTEFLKEIARVLQVPIDNDMEILKMSVIDAMQGLEGLLLVDNLEDIQDSEVFNFLLEIPEPVKTLVTSRVDKGLGALTISVPEMNEIEAKVLLKNELERLDYTGFYDEQDEVLEILKTTGNLPLALKWAAGLSSSLGSLKKAADKLRKRDTTKKEFLNFCFSTMYDVLSPLARDVALLCPYLGEEWNITTVSFALDKPETEISRAIDELKDSLPYRKYELIVCWGISMR